MPSVRVHSESFYARLKKLARLAECSYEFREAFDPTQAQGSRAGVTDDRATTTHNRGYPTVLAPLRVDGE